MPGVSAHPASAAVSLQLPRRDVRSRHGFPRKPQRSERVIEHVSNRCFPRSSVLLRPLVTGFIVSQGCFLLLSAAHHGQCRGCVQSSGVPVSALRSGKRLWGHNSRPGFTPRTEHSPQKRVNRCIPTRMAGYGVRVIRSMNIFWKRGRSRSSCAWTRRTPVAGWRFSGQVRVSP